MDLLSNTEKHNGAERAADRLSNPDRSPKNEGRISPARTSDDQLRQENASLREKVEELQVRNRDLRAECERLQEENRSLRKQVTHLRFLHELEEEIEAIETETGALPAPPPPAEHLYTLLPPSFSFSVFFEIADSQGLGTDETRRCLLHFLARDLVEQEGSRLVKTQKTIEEREASRSG